jgi:hypothetical protein
MTNGKLKKGKFKNLIAIIYILLHLPHLSRYKDSVTSVHTNTVEGMWVHVKGVFMGGRSKRPILRLSGYFYAKMEAGW